MKPVVRLLILLLLWLLQGMAQEAVRTYLIERPTILAFFPPVTEAELARDADTNEALGDFQLYAKRAAPKLEGAGIDFRVVNAVKFKIISGKALLTFSTGKVGVGYYHAREEASRPIRSHDRRRHY
jgi:hypothetical protein